jgi:predicted metal-binding transcription factor (methanogenesis marker protein 9)
MIDKMEDRAKLAAFILNETNPTKDCMKVFFDDLVHGELVSRAADEEERQS